VIATKPAASLPVASDVAAGSPSGGQRYRLCADRAGERLDVFVVRSLPNISRTRVQRIIQTGCVTVDQHVAPAGLRLTAGASVEITLLEPAPSALVPEALPIVIAYEDADLLVVDKPSGLVVHPSAGHDAGTLVHRLLAYCTDLSGIGGERRPGIVHRLDRDTSGMLLVAKNDRAHTSLTEQFQRRTVEKFYLALLQGSPEPERGVVDAPIGRHPTDRLRMAVRPNGRASRTRYATVARAGGRTMVVAGLDTGRTHQIRVHFAALGYPVIGDPIYGVADAVTGRLWLHAWRIAFDRPSDGMRVQLEAALPPELAASWKNLTSGAESESLDLILGRARNWAESQRPADPNAARRPKQTEERA
jgi:23S rRNA pseudouridine1911/1915/1917 synthase